MGGGHQHPILNFRPPAEVRDAARTDLATNGWTMQDFLTACLVALHADPKRVLRMIGPHRQKPAPAHRPRRKPAE